MAFENHRVSLRDHFFMDRYISKPGRSLPEQAHHIVGPPTTVANPAPTKTRQTGDLVSFRQRRFGILTGSTDYGLDGMGQFRSNTLIGIDRKHPVAGCQVKGPVFLGAEARPIGAVMHPGAQGGCNVAGAIGTARVKHDDFIGKCH